MESGAFLVFVWCVRPPIFGSTRATVCSTASSRSNTRFGINPTKNLVQEIFTYGKVCLLLIGVQNDFIYLQGKIILQNGAVSFLLSVCFVFKKEDCKQISICRMVCESGIICHGKHSAEIILHNKFLSFGSFCLSISIDPKTCAYNKRLILNIYGSSCIQ